MPTFDEDFWSQEGRELTKPNLTCLRQDASLYNTLLFQPNDPIAFNNHKIWIEDEKKAFEKFSQFIDLAISRDVELAITPEYSCPWDVVKSLLKDRRFPAEHNLWILGCQSISPEELQAVINENSNVYWIYEKELLNKYLQNQGSFFDPACIFLQTKDLQGQQKTVIIIQFKTEHFGGAGNAWERDSLIKGDKFFVLSNYRASTKLIVQICSDALLEINFNDIEQERFLNSPLLLIHIQLNQSPFQSNYKLYRNLLYTKGDKNFPKEIIALNWARKLKVGDEIVWNKYGGSGFYIKSDKLDLRDSRINLNHLRGLYYTNWAEKRSHIYFLAYDEYIFLVRNTKPSQLSGDPSQHGRTGPEVIELLKWEDGWKACSKADDGFSELCEEIESEIGEISCIKDSSDPINIERTIALSIGEIENSLDWFAPSHLSTFKVSDTEHNKRVNFTHDPEEAISLDRKKKIIAYATLKHTILKDPALLPANLKQPRLDYKIEHQNKESFLINISPASGGPKWTGAFISVATPKQAKAIREFIQSLFKQSQQGKNVIVWHYHGGKLLKEYDESALPSITENTERPLTSYKKTIE